MAFLFFDVFNCGSILVQFQKEMFKNMFEICPCFLVYVEFPHN